MRYYDALSNRARARVLRNGVARQNVEAQQASGEAAVIHCWRENLLRHMQSATSAGRQKQFRVALEAEAITVKVVSPLELANEVSA